VISAHDQQATTERQPSTNFTSELLRHFTTQNCIGRGPSGLLRDQAAADDHARRAEPSLYGSADEARDRGDGPDTRAVWATQDLAIVDEVGKTPLTAWRGGGEREAAREHTPGTSKETSDAVDVTEWTLSNACASS
jgi:hypothetical protein